MKKTVLTLILILTINIVVGFSQNSPMYKAICTNITTTSNVNNSKKSTEYNEPRIIVYTGEVGMFSIYYPNDNTVTGFEIKDFQKVDAWELGDIIERSKNENGYDLVYQKAYLDFKKSKEEVLVFFFKNGKLEGVKRCFNDYGFLYAITFNIL